MAPDLVQRLHPVVRGERLVSLALQAELQDPDDLGLVVDDQDARTLGGNHHPYLRSLEGEHGHVEGLVLRMGRAGPRRRKSGVVG